MSEKDNKLSAGDSFPGEEEENITNVDLYAAAKEVYLGKRCEVDGDPPWQFWMIMLKNGNLDTTAALCPENGEKVGPFRPQPGRFPCFGSGCMNQPLVYHNYTALDAGKLSGGLFGTYDLDGAADLEAENVSHFAVTWEKEVGKGGWVFHHVLRTTNKYPWLMLYLRSDATQGFSGGYHYQTRGMTRIVSTVPNLDLIFNKLFHFFDTCIIIRSFLGSFNLPFSLRFKRIYFFNFGIPLLHCILLFYNFTFISS